MLTDVECMEILLTLEQKMIESLGNDFRITALVQGEIFGPREQLRTYVEGCLKAIRNMIILRRAVLASFDTPVVFANEDPMTGEPVAEETVDPANVDQLEEDLQPVIVALDNVLAFID